MTIVMTPEKLPFFAATYVPKYTKFGRVGMVELIPRIEDVWANRRGEVMDSAEKIVGSLGSAAELEASRELGRGTLDRAFQELSSSFDPKHGGFGKAPKFPSPHNLIFLLRYWKRTGEPRALEMVEVSLKAMRTGGLFDHVGFGFHRYSTDQEWLVPHFEKMLYDQALLSIAYLEAWQATGDLFYKKTAEEVFTYVLRDMTTPEGAFCAAEDADSEGEEGKFYLWTEQEIREALPPAEADSVIKSYNVSPDGNYLDEATRRKTGANILYRSEPPAHREESLSGSLEKLFEARAKRVHPLKDDKVLMDWNGLMIAALARGAQVLGEPRYAEAAARAAGFLLDQLRQPDGGLLHRFRDGEAAIVGLLDDYAFMIWGLMELYEAVFDEGHLEDALSLVHKMRAGFEDPENGGFYFSPKEGERLIVRKKEIQDAAAPSGNSVAAMCLLRLGRLIGRTDMEEAALKAMNAVSGAVDRFPSAFSFLLTAFDFGMGPTYEIVVVGDKEEEETGKILGALRKRYVPGKVILVKPKEKGSERIVRMAPYVDPYGPVEGKAAAYICKNRACNMPLTDPVEIGKALDEG